MRRFLLAVLPDGAILGLLFLLPLLLFWQQTLGGQTLLPTENLYQFEPYATYREAAGAPAVPHNHLLSDLVLQNHPWKTLIRDQLAAGEVPLWNPHQFAGIPFMAAGQQSTLYPLSVLYYALPLPAAYGWFTVVNLFLAGAFTYAFLRGLGTGRAGAALAGIVYQLCGFFIASAVFPMILGGAAWLPLILLMVEYVIRREPLLGRPATAPWVVIGAVAVACNIFAGHVEITIYTLLIAGFYAAGRLLAVILARAEAWRGLLNRAGWLAAMVALGIGLGALQLIPLYEVASDNWRAERSDFAQVLSFAHPPRDVIQYAMPNFFGSPAQHHYFDWFALETRPVTVNMAGDAITHTEWGIKNYVEGALYVGILPLALAGFALLAAVLRRETPADRARRTQTAIFALLTLVALSFMFGLPTYALVYWLPGINQLNSPFRWVYAVTFGVAVLAGFGLDALARLAAPGSGDPHADRLRRWARRFGFGLLGGGLLVMLGLLASRLLYDRLAAVIADVLPSLAGQGGEVAADRFSGPAMFYSVQVTNALIFGGMLLLSGLVFWWAGRRVRATAPRRHALWAGAALLVVAADLMIASWGFNPASDPDLLDYTPEVIAWMQARQAEEGPFRYITLDEPGAHLPMLQANMTLPYGLDDVRGYDSIIPAQYVDYMRQVQVQPQLDFNRIAPLYLDRVAAGEVDWRRLGWLNVRYVVTHARTQLPADLIAGENPRLALAYEDAAVRVYRLRDALPRAFVTLPGPREDITQWGDGPLVGFDAVAERLNAREYRVTLNLTDDADARQVLVLSETYRDGWRAFVTPRGAGADAEQAVEVTRVYDNFVGVPLNLANLQATFAPLLADAEADGDPAAGQIRAALAAGEYSLRLVYSPTSFQVGLFGSVISAALLAFVLGVWVWRLFVAPDGGDGAAVSRVARNSAAPIILSLFNRGIDFVFAFVMLRILGPEDAGIYYYAVVVFVWFDIFTNFGLDVFLIREAARERARAGLLFSRITLLRLALMLAGVPLLIGFLFVRQSTIEPALNSEALLAIGLLYIGLAPGSLNKGLTSLFYAFEKAEYPAAVTTISTINRVVLQLGALLLGYGIVGLAAMSIVVNLMTLGILFYGARSLLAQSRGLLAQSQALAPQTADERGLTRRMLGESWPLMLNHFLATIFFQIDVVILEALRGARIVGQYSVAYRWLLALNIVPAFFTQALLPVMSRQASEDRVALKRTYTLAIKLMVAVALPLAVAFTFLAETLTLILGGPEFLPAGAVALQLMIWSIPFGWINSVTQYALVALDRQRLITRAFAVAVSFNIITNLLFIPQFGYRAAAVTTIFSELVLLLPFAVLMQRDLGRIAWWGAVWRPAAAAALMFAVLAVGWPVLPVPVLMVAGLLYPVTLLALRPLSREEVAMLRPVLPAPVQRRLGLLPGV